MERLTPITNLQNTSKFGTLPFNTIQRIYSYLSSSDRWHLHIAFGKELSEIIYGKHLSSRSKMRTFDDFLKLEKEKGYATDSTQSSIKIVDEQVMKDMERDIHKLRGIATIELPRRLYLFKTEFVHHCVFAYLNWRFIFDRDDKEQNPKDFQGIADKFNRAKYLDLEINSFKYNHIRRRIEDSRDNGYEDIGKEKESIVDVVKREAMGDIPYESVRKTLKQQNAENETISTIATLFPNLEGLNASSSFCTLKALMKLKNLTLLSLRIQDQSDSEFSEIFRHCKLKYFCLWSYHSLKIDELANVALCKTLEVISMQAHLLREIANVLTKENLPKLKAIGVMITWDDDDEVNLDAKKLLDELPKSLKLDMHEIITWSIRNYDDFAVFPNLTKLTIQCAESNFGVGFPKLPKLQTLICINDSCSPQSFTTEEVIASIEGLIGSCPELLEMTLQDGWVECCLADDSLNANTKSKLLQLIGGSLTVYHDRVSEMKERVKGYFSTRTIFTLFINQPEEISFLKDVVPAELKVYHGLRTGEEVFDPWKKPWIKDIIFSDYLKHIVMRNIREVENNSHSFMYS